MRVYNPETITTEERTIGIDAIAIPMDGGSKKIVMSNPKMMRDRMLTTRGR